MRLRTFLIPALMGLALSAFGEVTYVDGLVSIKVRPGNDAAATSAVRRLNGTVVRTLPQIGWMVVRLPKTTNLTTAMNSLKGQSSVSFVERVGMDRVTAEVNDPYAPRQYSLTRTQLKQAWDLTKGDTSVVVAIVDTGIDRGHPDLTGRVLPGKDVVNNDNDPDDDNGHGTHCAGIAAASANNAVGVAGAGYNVTILPVKAANAGGGLSYQWEADGIIYAADQGAHVISMSFGGVNPSQLVNDACQYAYKKGCLLVAAAGNDNSTALHYPADYPNVLSVASTDANDARSGFSNYGGDHTAVAAPGSDILSTCPRSFNPAGYDIVAPGYAIISGTSMACPLVAGIASLVIGYAGVGELTPDEVRNIITSTTDNVGTFVKYGRVNAFKAISATPVGVPEAPIPSAPVPYSGTLTNGTSEAISDADGVSATITGVKQTGVGYTGAVSTSFTVTQFTPANTTSAKLSFVAKTDRLATIQVYLSTGTSANPTWNLFTSKPGTGASQTVSINMTKAQLSQYMGSGSTLRVMVRALVPTRYVTQSKGITQIDQLKAEFRGKKTPTP